MLWLIVFSQFRNALLCMVELRRYQKVMVYTNTTFFAWSRDDILLIIFISALSSYYLMKVIAFSDWQLYTTLGCFSMSRNKSCRSFLYVNELINILIAPALILFRTMEVKFYFLPYLVAYSVTFIISYNNINWVHFHWILHYYNFRNCGSWSAVKQKIIPSLINVQHTKWSWVDKQDEIVAHIA